jgi:excisionase family DNA binding protein
MTNSDSILRGLAELIAEQVVIRMHSGSPVGTSRLMTIREVAAYLKCSTSTVKRYLDDGLLPRIGTGKLLRVDRGDVDRLIMANKETAL